MKKSIVLCLALIVSLFAVTGSIAYFTDSVTANENVVASGNLDIEQFELERVTDENGNVTLTEWTSKAIYPAVGDNPTHVKGTYSYDVTIKNPANEDVKVTGTLENIALMNPASLRGFVDKIVVVKNFGSLPVYVRTFVAVPSVFDNYIELDWNTAGGWVVAETPITDKITDTDHKVDYTIYYATCQTKVEPNASAAPSLLGFHLDPDFKNSDSNVELRILVATQASQVIPTGFENESHDTAEDSMTKTYDTVNADNTVTIKHPWAE